MSLNGDEYLSDYVYADALPAAPTAVTTLANRSTLHVEWNGHYNLGDVDGYEVVLSDVDGPVGSPVSVPGATRPPMSPGWHRAATPSASGL